MFYRFFYVDKKRVVVGLNFDDGLKIKLKWGPIIEIGKFMTPAVNPVDPNLGDFDYAA